MYVGIACTDRAVFAQLGEPAFHQKMQTWLLEVECLSPQVTVIERLGPHEAPVYLSISDKSTLNTGVRASEPFKVGGQRRTIGAAEETKVPEEDEPMLLPAVPAGERDCHIFDQENGKFLYLPNAAHYTPPCGWEDYVRGINIKDGRAPRMSTGARAFYFETEMFSGWKVKTQSVKGLSIPRKPREGQWHEHVAYEMKFELDKDSRGKLFSGRGFSNGLSLGEIGNVCEECVEGPDSIQQVLMAQAIAMFVETSSEVRRGLFKAMSEEERATCSYPLREFDESRVAWDMPYKKCLRKNIMIDHVTKRSRLRASTWLNWEVENHRCYSGAVDGEPYRVKRRRTS